MQTIVRELRQKNGTRKCQRTPTANNSRLPQSAAHVQSLQSAACRRLSPCQRLRQSAAHVQSLQSAACRRLSPCQRSINLLSLSQQLTRQLNLTAERGLLQSSHTLTSVGCPSQMLPRPCLPQPALRRTPLGQSLLTMLQTQTQTQMMSLRCLTETHSVPAQ